MNHGILTALNFSRSYLKNNKKPLIDAESILTHENIARIPCENVGLREYLQ